MRRQWWIVAAVVAVALWFFVSIEPVLAPFFVSMVLAYLGDPLADRLEDRGLSRRLAVTVVFVLLSLAIILTLVLVVPVLGRQAGQLVEAFPAILNWIQTAVLPEVQSLTGLDLSTDFDELRKAVVENWKETSTIAATLLAQVSRSGLALVGWLANLALIPVVTFYLLLDWDVLVGKIRQSLPRQWEPAAVRLASECDEVLSSFLRGQLIVMLCLGIIYAIGLTLLGVRFGLLIGLLSGLASIVPYLGVIVGITVAGLVTFFQFHDWLMLLGVALVFGFGQLAESVVLQPKLLGDKIGLHPVAVIFAVLAGGQLFGFTGVLLALPVAAMVMVVLRYLHENYKNSTLYDAGQKVADRPSESASDEENT
ncbi:AI-2E family transporter [Halomonas cupida]|uniref:AI-2E family transporter n=1 Tax=Halomonas cupida TaxID=44933 RepID=A0A1M7AKY8_9GAMM|nr:AI-2E family transporter [Halomonas cupida]GEN22342.1 AI-2E family transporter [Halomonas cupida]SHL43398.1 Predicted PurR-regulated permease PerM [Halomonas cupida]